MLLCILFAMSMQYMHIQGRGTHVFAVLHLLTTSSLCYVAKKHLIEMGHNWLEAIPLVSDISTVLWICGNAGV